MARKHPSIKVSDFGANLETTSTATGVLIKVVKDISTTAASTTNAAEKKRLQRWVKELTSATGNIIHSSSNTTDKVAYLIGGDDPKK